VQQLKLDREERILDQSQANKELIRNLAHEIKNPLGGIRGAAQLLELELPALHAGQLREYTQVIIKEADRLQTLVDRLLAPHRRPHIVGDVNIHEVLRARAQPGAGRIPVRPDDFARLRRLDSRVPRRQGAADPDRAEHRPQRRPGAGRARIEAGDAEIVLRTGWRARSRWPRSVTGWH
jgi:two-component system nitrogen regulation sensor histidine kinase GlnL